jgi:hypothetical protein
MATRLNFTVDQGSDFDRAMEFRDESSTLIDLTGYTFRGQARTSVDASSVSFSLTFTVRTQSGGNLGYVDMRIADSDTSALSITKDTVYVYDIEWVKPNGDVRRIFEGQITVRPEVTR